MKNIQHVVVLVLLLVMMLLIHYQSLLKLVFYYASQAAFVRKDFIDQRMVNVFDLNNAVVKMKSIKLVVQLVLKHVTQIPHSVRNNVFLDVSVLVRIMFDEIIIPVVLVFSEKNVQKNVMIKMNSFFCSFNKHQVELQKRKQRVFTLIKHHSVVFLIDIVCIVQ